MHFEVKRTERLSIYKAMDQATLDAGTDDVPIVLHRKNHEQWLAIVPLSELQTLAERIVNQCNSDTTNEPP